MKLIPPTNDQLFEMMSWFRNESELRDWAGPNFRYPFDSDTFIEDLSSNSIISFALSSDDSGFLAFGQLYNRLGRCHLSRLVVSPSHRGKGIIVNLIRLLTEYGLRELGLDSISLFVTNQNEVAMAVYKDYGFKMAEYPEVMPLENCFYMIKE